jgi:uncharacterized protein with HEPN domain
MKTTSDYLRDLLERIERIQQYVQAGEQEFWHSSLTQDAVVRNFEVIGEIVKRLPPNLLSQYPDVEWSQIKGFRDYLAHNYETVQLKIVWGAVAKLPILKAAVETLLASLPRDESQE